MYVPLHVHSEFSLLDGVSSPEDWVKAIKSKGGNTIAITDHGNIDCAVAFQKAASRHGIKPIFGCEGYIVPQYTKDRKRGHIILWVQNEEGFKNLAKIVSIANTEGFYYKPRMSFQSILDNKEGLIISTACPATFLNFPEGEDFLVTLSKNNVPVFLEVMPTDTNQQKKINAKMLRLNRKYGFKIVATNDCHYINKEDAKSQEVLLAIQTNSVWNNPNRFRFDSRSYYLMDQKEMAMAFAKQGVFTPKQIKMALDETHAIASMCGFELKKREIELPEIRIDKEDYSQELKSKTINLFRQMMLDEKIPQERTIEYRRRMLYELDTICSKNFAQYFLIVSDLVDWCRTHGVVIGPRGSVGGSLVAHILGINSLDPIKHNLIFERFISKDRDDYPDIDLDFQDDQRAAAVDYLRRKYGEGRIANISSFIRMKDKLIVRDVARVFEIPLREVDEFLGELHDDVVDLESLLNTKKGKLFANKHPEIVKHALRLRQGIKAYGKHAGGIIVSKSPIQESGYAVVTVRDNTKVINWDMGDCDYLGFVKIDVLAVKILSVLSATLRRIKENHGVDIELTEIPLDEPQIYKDISERHTSGVFQFNTWAMTKLCNDLKPSSFEELTATVALVRPGPLDSGMTKMFIERKKGKTYEIVCPEYDEITKDTYGCICYQEQVMECVVRLAGLTYKDANKVRKIIAKKRDPREFELYKQMFIDGCVRQETLTKKQAQELWAGFELHARYSFNKCLSGSTVVYQCDGQFYKMRSIRSLLNEKEDIFLLRVDDDRLVPGKLKAIHNNDIKIVWKITTSFGKEIKATPNHRFLTDSGYKELQEINIFKDQIITANIHKGICEKENIRRVINIGVETVYDIEMEDEPHNFIANGIVSHNSHASAYSMIGYWSAWLKNNYPEEFIASSLQHTPRPEKKGELIADAERFGLKVLPPMQGISDSHEWIIKDKKIYMPFVEIKGIGDVTAKKIVGDSNKKSGGFLSSVTVKPSVPENVQAILKDIDNGKVSMYLDYEYPPKKSSLPKDHPHHPSNNKRLFEVFGNDIFPSDIPDIHKGLIVPEMIVSKTVSSRKGVIAKNLIIQEKKSQIVASGCDKCKLRDSRNKLVETSLGKYNVFVLGEAPGPAEDKEGVGFVGPSGQKLWKTMRVFKLTREMFHVGNVCKCFPGKKDGKIITPMEMQVKRCANIWLKKELESAECRIALCLGNSVRLALTGIGSGIKDVSGEIEWLDKWGLWAVWCLHPSGVRGENDKYLFQQSIEKFSSFFKKTLKIG